MSAAGESGLRIVIATCAGGSAHRRAGAEFEALQRQARWGKAIEARIEARGVRI
jgi:hypothetical protein